MGADAVPICVVTGFWAIVAIILPFILGRGPNKGVIQVMLVISGFSCWIFWLLCYMHQMNPLIGPQLHNTTVLAIQYLWDGSVTIDDFTTVAGESTTVAGVTTTVAGVTTTFAGESTTFAGESTTIPTLTT